MDRLDDIVRDALRALEGQTPRDYFDELPARIDARLEGSMQTDQDLDADARSPRIPAMTDPTHPGDGTPRNEDSGLHDIKQLAHSTKERIRRQSSHHEAQDPMLSSSQSGLHAVALPVPSRMSQRSADEERELAMTASGIHAAVAVDSPPTPITSARRADRAPAKAEKARGVPAWLWAGGGLAAAAAAVLAFTQLGGQDKASTPTAAPAPETTAAAPAADPGITVRGIEETPPAAAVAPQEIAPPPPPTADPALVAADSAAAEADGELAEGRAKKSERLERKDEAKVERKHKADDKAAPVDVQGAKKDVKKDVKKDATTDPKSGTKADSAVIGAGDSDELGIGAAIAGGGGGTKDDKPEKTELSSKEMRDGLNAITGAAKACYGAHGVGGTVKVKLTIAPSGTVAKATATGEFAGTPSGDCVVAAVKSASFPAWDGVPKSTTFVVLLSD